MLHALTGRPFANCGRRSIPRDQNKSRLWPGQRAQTGRETGRWASRVDFLLLSGTLKRSLPPPGILRAAPLLRSAAGCQVCALQTEIRQLSFLCQDLTISGWPTVLKPLPRRDGPPSDEDALTFPWRVLDSSHPELRADPLICHFLSGRSGPSPDGVPASGDGTERQAPEDQAMLLQQLDGQGMHLLLPPRHHLDQHPGVSRGEAACALACVFPEIRGWPSVLGEGRCSGKAVVGSQTPGEGARGGRRSPEASGEVHLRRQSMARGVPASAHCWERTARSSSLTCWIFSSTWESAGGSAARHNH